ncbi:hypothetical protein BJX70DRAFT_40661 [Aspergillus crustosus]
MYKALFIYLTISSALLPGSTYYLYPNTHGQIKFEVRLNYKLLFQWTKIRIKNGARKINHAIRFQETDWSKKQGSNVRNGMSWRLR